MTTMTMAVMVVMLVVVMLIGTTSTRMRSEWLASLIFFSFWCLKPKGEKLEESILSAPMLVALQQELHVIFIECSLLGVSLRVAQNSILL